MKQNYPLHIFLFVLTVGTTLMAGTELVTGRNFIWGSENLGFSDLWRGIPFSAAFLSFLTVHEFGHYFTALYHRVRCSLPYYIPIFIPLPLSNIGSFGAVIRIREVPPSRRKYFDIGVAGPLAGFVVALGLLLYGFMALPPLEPTVLEIHPSYLATYGGVPTEAQMAGSEGAFNFGGSLLYEGIKWLFRNDPDMPPSFEIMHYPFILAGFLGLFFTALNMLPIGQLDGGHVVYGLLGARRAGYVARATVVGLLLLGGMGIFSPAAYVMPEGESIWEFLMWVVPTRLAYFLFLSDTVRRAFATQPLVRQLLVIGGILAVQGLVGLLLPLREPNILWLIYAAIGVRFVGVDHPVAIDDTPLTTKQKVLGILALLIFVLCFSPDPISAG